MSTETSILADHRTTVSDIRYRICRPTDLPACLQIETASYPPDESATESSLRYRQENASPYFLCAVISETTTSLAGEGINQETVVGFICGTRCHTFTHDSMTAHAPKGSILAIHSVVVLESYRRRGIATQMLQHYVRTIEQQQRTFATSIIEEARISKISLLAKSHLLSFYVDCGFQVT